MLTWPNLAYILSCNHCYSHHSQQVYPQYGGFPILVGFTLINQPSLGVPPFSELEPPCQLNLVFDFSCQGTKHHIRLEFHANGWTLFQGHQHGAAVGVQRSWALREGRKLPRILVAWPCRAERQPVSKRVLPQDWIGFQNVPITIIMNIAGKSHFHDEGQTKKLYQISARV